MIKVSVIGNVGADCVVKESNGSKFAVLRVADTTKVKHEDGSTTDKTIWVDVVISNTEWKVIPFLKRGVKVYVCGNASLRVYSSPKDKCMKAGLTINATDIQLCGGSSDDVPHQLVNPSDGSLIDVSKHYWVNVDTSKMKKDELSELLDPRGGRYLVNKAGFVVPASDDNQSEEETK